MTDLILRCQQRSDKEQDLSISRAEWCQLISESYGELYTIVFECGLEYFEFAQQLTTTGAATLSEVGDHLSTVTLAYLEDVTNKRYRALRELMAQERTRWSLTNGQGGSRALAFALVDDQIYLYPTPPAGQIYELRYVPQPPELTEFVSGSTPFQVDVVTPDGLTFLIWATTVKANAKVERDSQLAMAEREAARQRFTESVQLRALNAPRRRILDIEAEDMTTNGWDD